MNLVGTPSAASAVQPVPRRWTRDEYHQMRDLGFFSGQRVELIWGEVFQHAAADTVQPIPRRWTCDEYYELVAKDFFRGERVELIWGRVMRMPPMLSQHAMGILLAEDELEKAFGAGHHIRIQMPLDIPTTSSPEPDVAVVVGSPRDYVNHPRTAVLVVEVSESTLAFDRNTKGPLYASASLPEYWIVNLVDRQLEVYRDPQPDANDPTQSRYGQLVTLPPGAEVTPLAAPNGKIKIDDLLP